MFLIFKNDLSNAIKSETERFAEDVKLLVRPLWKETVQINLNKLSYSTLLRSQELEPYYQMQFSL